jgi:hypothetical protein
MPNKGSERHGSAAPVIDPNAGLGADVSAIVANAARGDLEAQRRIRQAWSNSLYGEPQHPNADLLAASGLLAARMCAANGDHTDINKLAMLLLNAGIRYSDGGRHGLGWECVAESLALYQRMSDAGDEEATDAIDKLVPALPAEMIEHARRYLKQGEA